MHYEERAPAGELRHYVRAVWRLTAAAGEIPPQLVSPDGAVAVIACLADPLVDAKGTARPLPAVTVDAALTEPLTLTASGRCEVVGIRFQPGGAYPFLLVEPPELLGKVVASAPVLAPALDAAVRHLDAEHASPLEHLLAALRSTLDSARIDARFDRLMKRLRERQHGVTIDSLAQDSGLSARTVERSFLCRVGLPPQTVQRLIRFRASLPDVLSGVPLTDVAAAHGYSDQSHLTREFGSLSGASPARCRTARRELDRLFVSGQGAL